MAQVDRQRPAPAGGGGGGGMGWVLGLVVIVLVLLLAWFLLSEESREEGPAEINIEMPEVRPPADIKIEAPEAPRIEVPKEIDININRGEREPGGEAGEAAPKEP